MNNAELVAALRSFDACESCPCEHPEMCENADCIVIQAADLIEAQAKRIEELERDWEKAAALATEYEAKAIELEAQMPKEGEWIDMGGFEMCSVCKIAQRKKYRQYNDGFMWVREDFCGNCGSRMRKGEQE